MVEIKNSRVIENAVFINSEALSILAGKIKKSSIFDNAAFPDYEDIHDFKFTAADIVYCNFAMPCGSMGKTTSCKIGKTTFVVTASFSGAVCETAEDMLVRYVSDQISSAGNLIEAINTT